MIIFWFEINLIAKTVNKFSRLNSPDLRLFMLHILHVFKGFMFHEKKSFYYKKYSKENNKQKIFHQDSIFSLQKKLEFSVTYGK